MLACTHVIKLSLHHDGRISAPMSLYQYFKLVSESLPDPEGPLSETLSSATICIAKPLNRLCGTSRAIYAYIVQLVPGVVYLKVWLCETKGC